MNNNKSKYNNGVCLHVMMLFQIGGLGKSLQGGNFLCRELTEVKKWSMKIVRKAVFRQKEQHVPRPWATLLLWGQILVKRTLQWSKAGRGTTVWRGHQRLHHRGPHDDKSLEDCELRSKIAGFYMERMMSCLITPRPPAIPSPAEAPIPP